MINTKRGIIGIFILLVLLAGTYLVYANSPYWDVTPNFPPYGTYTTNTTPALNVTIRVNCSTVMATLYINNFTSAYRTLNVTNNTQTTFIPNASFYDGNHTWYVNATSTCDSAATYNASYGYSIYIDTTNPVITFDNSTFNSYQDLWSLNSSRYNGAFGVNVNQTELNGANLTFRVYNSLGVLVNQTNCTVNTTNMQNFTTATLGNDADEAYTYNVEITDRAGNQVRTHNRTIYLVNGSSFAVTLVTLNNSIDTGNPRYFRYSVTDTGTVANCTINLGTEFAITRNATQQGTRIHGTTYEFAVWYLPATTKLTWYVSCVNNISGIANSSTYFMDTMTTIPQGSSGSNNDATTSAAAATGTTYDVGKIGFSGTEKTIAAGDKLSMEVAGEDYELKLNSVGSTSVTLYLSGVGDSVTISEGSTKKLDLDGDGDYDVFVKCEDITSTNKAKLKVSLYSESAAALLDEETTEESTDEEATGEEAVGEEIIGEETPIYKSWWLWTLIGVVIIAGVIIFLAMTKN